MKSYVFKKRDSDVIVGCVSAVDADQLSAAMLIVGNPFDYVYCEVTPTLVTFDDTQWLVMARESKKLILKEV